MPKFWKTIVSKQCCDNYPGVLYKKDNRKINAIQKSKKYRSMWQAPEYNAYWYRPSCNVVTRGNVSLVSFCWTVRSYHICLEISWKNFHQLGTFFMEISTVFLLPWCFLPEIIRRMTSFTDWSTYLGICLIRTWSWPYHCYINNNIKTDNYWQTLWSKPDVIMVFSLFLLKTSLRRGHYVMENGENQHPFIRLSEIAFSSARHSMVK